MPYDAIKGKYFNETDVLKEEVRDLSTRVTTVEEQLQAVLNLFAARERVKEVPPTS